MIANRPVKAIPTQVKGPCLLNSVPGGMTPIVDTAEAARLGDALANLPDVALGPMMRAVSTDLAALARTGLQPTHADDLSPQQVFAAFGAGSWRRLG